MLFIRKATPDDLEDIALIHFEAWTTAYENIFTPEELAWGSLSSRLEKWRSEIEKPGHGHYVATERGETVGFFSLISPADSGLPPETLELQSIYFSPTQWRKGYGTQCTSFILSVAREQGATLLTVWVPEENRSAREFHEKLGFREDGAKKTVGDTTPVREVRYRMDL